MTARRFPHIVWPGALLLAGLYWIYWRIGHPDPALLERLGFLPGVGVLGAIVANASGTGGGVVFVPVFHALDALGRLHLTAMQVTAASMGIQSMGMTMGSLRWTERLLHQDDHPLAPGAAHARIRDYAAVIALVLALSLPALLATQRLFRADEHAVLVGYKLFSIALGSILVVVTWTIHRELPERTQLEKIDLAVLALLAVPGGFITALFSVGMGEIVALYLFIRHYPLVLCTGTACAISAVSVLAGLGWHVAAGTVPWEVVVLAAPGAALGGFLARPIAIWLGARRLKTAAGLWIVCSSLYLMALTAR
ncbi:MAG: sulfite exporter TauE/SafE family protein [Sphingomonadales bacterium]|nr:sulfite exporter TauE/SafE family protein [Sphingomonadales bacterium]MDE2567736.1 sulfite exporter TauE/SafE family protein [Sphingomonadales bacterium]